jgi:predicted dinucleotide-binding enzyme
VLTPGAEPRWAADAVEDADIAVLAIRLHKFAALDPALLADEVVVDAMNYVRRSSRRSTTLATTNSKMNADPRTHRNAARSVSPETTPVRWMS